jgi:hypothetical protein
MQDEPTPLSGDLKGKAMDRELKGALSFTLGFMMSLLVMVLVTALAQLRDPIWDHSIWLAQAMLQATLL